MMTISVRSSQRRHIAIDLDLTDDYQSISSSAGSFNGNSSMITIEDNEIIKENNISIEGMFKFNGLPSSEQSGAVLNKYNWLNGERNFRIVCTDTLIVAVVYFGNTLNDEIKISTTIDKGEWHQFYLTITEANIVSFYLDGCLIDSLQMPQPMKLSNQPLIIGNTILGGNSPGNNHHFNGTIDEIRVYNKCLKEEELTWIVNKTTSTKNEPFYENNLVVYPNPFKNIISVTSKSNIEILTLYDSNGNKIISSKNNHLNIQSIPSGLYYLYIKTDNGYTVSKLFKE